MRKRAEHEAGARPPVQIPARATRPLSAALVAESAGGRARRRGRQGAARWAARLLSTLTLCLSMSVGPALADSYEDSLAAAQLGETRQLVRLLERGLDPDTVDAQGNTLLILAAREGHADTVAALLKYRPRVSRQNQAGDSALMMAALKGKAEVVDVLLRGGAQVNHEGWTPLMYASFEGHDAIVERLLAAGAEVNALAPNKSSALMVAARNGHKEVVRRLLGAGANLDQTNDQGFTAESWAVAAGNTDIAELIRAERARRPARPSALRIEVK